MLPGTADTKLAALPLPTSRHETGGKHQNSSRRIVAGRCTHGAGDPVASDAALGRAARLGLVHANTRVQLLLTVAALRRSQGRHDASRRAVGEAVSFADVTFGARSACRWRTL